MMTTWRAPGTTEEGILKQDDGLIQMHRCPKCGYWVKWPDMEYEDADKDTPRICRFCEKG